MKIVTKQFGEVEFSEDLIVSFPKGIIGFEKSHRFIIIDDEDYEPFKWLISLDEYVIGFPVLNPFLVSPEFGKELPNRLVKRLFSSDELLDAFCVVTLNGEGGKVTINLKSPVVINYMTKEGEQIILPSEELPIAKPIS